MSYIEIGREEGANLIFGGELASQTGELESGDRKSVV